MADPDPDPDLRAAKRALADLAVRDPVERAVGAVDDLETAARFAESGGVERLRRTLERRDREAGRRALAAFERYRAACHFRSGHATDLKVESVTEGE